MQQSLDFLLEQSGKSVAELAEASGLPPRRVLAIVDGCWLASPSERRLLATVFELSAEDIAWGHTMPPRNVRYHQFGLQEDINSASEEE